MTQIPLTPDNIAAVANVEIPLARTDRASFSAYRQARDFIRDGAECLGEGNPMDCLRACTSEEASLCGRYALLLLQSSESMPLQSE